MIVDILKNTMSGLTFEFQLFLAALLLVVILYGLWRKVRGKLKKAQEANTRLSAENRKLRVQISQMTEQHTKAWATIGEEINVLRGQLEAREQALKELREELIRMQFMKRISDAERSTAQAEQEKLRIFLELAELKSLQRIQAIQGQLRENQAGASEEGSDDEIVTGQIGNSSVSSEIREMVEEAEAALSAS